MSSSLGREDEEDDIWSEEERIDLRQEFAFSVGAPISPHLCMHDVDAADGDVTVYRVFIKPKSLRV